MKDKAPPKQLFIVSQDREEYEYNNDYYKWEDRIITHHNLGFMHPHEPNVKTDAKRKQTQMDWAYRDREVYQKEDGVWWWKVDNGKWVTLDELDSRGRNKREYVHDYFDEPIPLDYAPRVWDNVPLSGFKIIDTVNRYRGNKLFKVLDPRGIEFEITVQSLFNLIQTGTISKGEIMGECIWKHGKNLVFA